ncbi:anaerobic sulfatase maturase [Vibrio sp. E150_011]
MQKLPYSLTIKPVGATCNLDCSYCYYLSNEGCRPSEMPSEMVDVVVKNHIESQPKKHTSVDFIWHGGEPMLRGRAFYQHAFEQQQRWAGDKTIVNTIQTNGTLINRQWALFFRDHNVMVGVSIDGPNLLNDMARIDKTGQSSFERTMAGISRLKEYDIEFNTLTVINRRTYQHGQKIYHFLKQAGSRYLQFQPCLDHELDRRSSVDWSLTGEQWGQFLCDVFDEWCKDDIGKVYVQFFENCLMILMGQPSQMCHHSAQCGQQLMMEANADVYSCDHYGYTKHRIGDGFNTPLQFLVTDTQQREFAEQKQATLSTHCRECDFLQLCQGGCPKYRIEKVTDEKGENEQQHNVLCAGYQQFFRYALPRMLKMVDAMNSGYSPQYYSLV